MIAFIGGGLLIAGAAIASHLLGAQIELLRVGNEGNLARWYSSIQLFTTGLVLAVVAFRDTRMKPPRKAALVALPTTFFLLSLDEVATLHERLGPSLRRLLRGAQGHDHWTFFFLPLVVIVAAIAAWAFWPYVRRRRDALVLGFAGMALLGVSAVGLDLLSRFISEDSLQKQALRSIEEYGEMVAVSLLLWSALVVTRHEGIRLDLGRGREGEVLQGEGAQSARLPTGADSRT